MKWIICLFKNHTWSEWTKEYAVAQPEWSRYPQTRLWDTRYCHRCNKRQIN